MTPEGVPGLIWRLADRRSTCRALWTPFIAPAVATCAKSRRPRVAAGRLRLRPDGDNGKSVIKGYYGRFYFNSAPDTIADLESTRSARTRLRYQLDSTSTATCSIDNPTELGAFRSTVRVAAGRCGRHGRSEPEAAVRDEFSTHFEREIVDGAVRPCLVRLQEHAQRVGDRRHRSGAAAYTTTVHRHAISAPTTSASTGDDQTLESARPDRRSPRIASSPTRRIRNTKSTTTPSSSPSIADSAASGCSSRRSATRGWISSTTTTSSTDALGALATARTYNWRPNSATVR